MAVLTGARTMYKLLTIVAIAFSCVSCSTGPTMNPVHGIALFNDQPIEGVTLTFHPKGADFNTILPIGVTMADGTFTLKTGNAEGAPAGEYTVTAICMQNASAKEKKGMNMSQYTPEDRFKGAYANEAKSQIKVGITEGKNELKPINFQ